MKKGLNRFLIGLNTEEYPDMVSHQELETFYDKFWRDPSFSSGELITDEQLRANAILRFIEKYVLSAFDAKQNFMILDLGCGRGWLTNILARFGQVIGIDPLEASITRARELFPHLNFRIGTATDILSNGELTRFQLIVSTEVIEHIPDKEKKFFIKSMHSLLVPGGFAILTTPRGELWNAWKRVHPVGQPIEDWVSEYELEQLSYSVGFRIIDRDRIFLPNEYYNFASRIMISKYFRFIASCFPLSRILAKLHYYLSIYQVILLQRVENSC